MKKFILVFLWVIGGMCTVFSQEITKNSKVSARICALSVTDFTR